MNKKVPILFTIFNRKDVSLKAFRSIKLYQPDFLYISADGPRSYKTGEYVLCEETRKAVLNEIDWPCNVKTLFQKENKGCAYAMYEGISWFFENEEWGIICEDDIVLSHDFYKICEVLLPKYAYEYKIMEISAQNYTPIEDISSSFIFTNSFYCWGWASWRRAWMSMDMELSFWPKISLFTLISSLGLFQGIYYKFKISRAYQDLDHFNSWAVRWFLSILYCKGLVMLATTNLSLNVGLDIEGAHYEKDDENLYKHLKMGKMVFPLKFPKEISLTKYQICRERMDFFRIKFHGMKKKVKKIINHFCF